MLTTVILIKGWLAAFYCAFEFQLYVCLMRTRMSTLLHSVRMALRVFRLSLALIRNLLKTTVVCNTWHLSEKASSNPKASVSTENIDHVLYTEEHFALKASLRKVDMIACYCIVSLINVLFSWYLIITLTWMCRSNLFQQVNVGKGSLTVSSTLASFNWIGYMNCLGFRF